MKSKKNCDASKDKALSTVSVNAALSELIRIISTQIATEMLDKANNDNTAPPGLTIQKEE